MVDTNILGGSISFGAIYIDKNNTLYVVNQVYNAIYIWPEGSLKPTRNITGNISYPNSIFVTNNGDLYIDNGYSYGCVEKRILNDVEQTCFRFGKFSCYSVFIDIQKNLYCSAYNSHQVLMKPVASNSNLTIIVAGQGCSGSASNRLTSPQGIFVDTDLNLYIADAGNNRIQKYLPNQTTGITIAGSGANGTITLYNPSAVVFDADGYLFIIDSANHRIIGSGPTGFRCIIACLDTYGSSPTQLYYPKYLSFDSYGNIYVVDGSNYRVQKFRLVSNVTINCKSI